MKKFWGTFLYIWISGVLIGTITGVGSACEGLLVCCLPAMGLAAIICKE